MIEEEYVSFETAKLAKEKGFDGQSRFAFGNDGSEGLPFDKDILMPTQSLLARWLREKCGKNIYVVMGNSERYIVWIQDIHSLVKVKITNFFDTYEYAMEEGLQQALKLIN